MSSYDATTRFLSDEDEPLLLQYLLQRFNLPTGAVLTKLPGSLPSVTLEADAVYRIEGNPPYLIHLEYESSWQANRPSRFMRYHMLLGQREELPVKTIVVLQRPEANSNDMTGEWVQRDPHGNPTLLFRYEVVRLWDLPYQEFLNGGKGLWPLAPLANVREEELPGLMLELQKRWRTMPAKESTELAHATFILMGLRYEQSLILQLYRGITTMEESVTYQMILNKGKDIGLITGRQEGHQEGRQEGRQEGEQRMARVALISVLESKFGQIPSDLTAAIEQITDVNRLARMLKVVFSQAQPSDILQVH